jgi:hypothetical protein
VLKHTSREFALVGTNYPNLNGLRIEGL